MSTAESTSKAHINVKSALYHHVDPVSERNLFPHEGPKKACYTTLLLPVVAVSVAAATIAVVGVAGGGHVNLQSNILSGFSLKVTARDCHPYVQSSPGLKRVAVGGAWGTEREGGFVWSGWIFTVPRKSCPEF